jgi:hypothetical protein
MASAFESERRQVKVVSIAGFRNNISRSVWMRQRITKSSDGHNVTTGATIGFWPAPIWAVAIPIGIGPILKDHWRCIENTSPLWHIAPHSDKFPWSPLNGPMEGEGCWCDSTEIKYSVVAHSMSFVVWTYCIIISLDEFNWHLILIWADLGEVVQMTRSNSTIYWIICQSIQAIERIGHDS